MDGAGPIKRRRRRPRRDSPNRFAAGSQSDVPLGALLSGGIDSSLVTALMQKSASAPVRTFSIGMDQKGYDESSSARAVARHLQTDHTELISLGGRRTIVVPMMAKIYDEPFADSFANPDLSRLQNGPARRHCCAFRRWR